jgi:hypothetical protein
MLWDGGALEVDHVRFDRPVTMGFAAIVDLNAVAYYEPVSKLITVHAQTSTDVAAELDVMGPVDAHARSLAAQWLARAKPLDQRVRRQVRTDGAAQLAAKVEDGASLVVSLQTPDRPHFAPGLLKPGVLPEAPIPAAPNAWVNERIKMRPPGILIRGPFDPARQARVIADVEGGTVRVAAVCAHELAPLPATVGSEGHAGLERLAATAVGSRPVALVGQHVPAAALQLPACRWVAVVWADANADGTVAITDGGF